MKQKGIFITATDTDAGKTYASMVLGHLLQDKEVDVGYMKPVQCGGDDASKVTNSLDLRDDFDLINPYYFEEALSPNVASKRAGRKIDPEKIIKAYKKLRAMHEMMIVEGAGGLLVPLCRDYLIADLIKDLELDVIIVARLGLGTINHTLLSIDQSKNMGIKVKGILFSNTSKKKVGIPERTNPGIIKDCSGVEILGQIPFLSKTDKRTILSKCEKSISINKLFKTAGKANTSRLAEMDRKYVWHPFTQMQGWMEEEPIVIDRAKGSYLIDTEGKKYLDGVSSLWVNVHGHGKKHIDQAIKAQINKLSHSTLLGLSNTPSVELAKELVAITPKGLEKVFYSDSGSTSVEIAIKMAYQYWQNIGKKKKTKIVHLENSYHGDTLGSVSVGGISLFHEVYSNLIFKAIKLEFQVKSIATCSNYFNYLKGLDALLKKKGDTVCAFIVEPIVQGAAGMLMWPKGVLKEMARICKKYDVLFIVDEVATGFGRTGKMFACEHEGVSPDIMCLAKGITGGYLPLAATLTTNRVFDGFLFDHKDKKTFFHGHTYTGNPLCCAAALANLEVFKKERTLEKLQPKIKFLAKGLKRFEDLNCVGEVRQKGFMVGIELVKDKKTMEPFDWEEAIGVKVCKSAREKGVILRPLGSVIVLMPPLSISLKELKFLLDVTYSSIKEIVRFI